MVGAKVQTTPVLRFSQTFLRVDKRTRLPASVIVNAPGTIYIALIYRCSYTARSSIPSEAKSSAVRVSCGHILDAHSPARGGGTILLASKQVKLPAACLSGKIQLAVKQLSNFRQATQGERTSD